MNFMTIEYFIRKSESGLDNACLDLLTIDRLQDLATTTHRRLLERLTLTQLEQCLGFLEFLLVLFERLVDVFAIL